MIQSEFSRESYETDAPPASSYTSYENRRILKMDMNVMHENSYKSHDVQPLAGNYSLQVAASIASGDICSAVILRSGSRKHMKKLSEGSNNSRNPSTLPSTTCSTLRSFLSSSRSTSSSGTLKKHKEPKGEKKSFFSFFHWFRRRKRTRRDEDEYRKRRSSSVQSDTSISSSFHYVPMMYAPALSTGNSPLGDKKLIFKKIENKEKVDDVLESKWENSDSLKYRSELGCEEASSSGMVKKQRERRSSTSTLHKKKRKAPPPPNQVKNEEFNGKNEILGMPNSLANDSLNKIAIRQIKEKARLKKKRRAPSPPYKTIGVNTEDGSHNGRTVQEEGCKSKEELLFVDITNKDEDVSVKEEIHEKRQQQWNDLSRECQGAEAAAVGNNVTDDNLNDNYGNYLKVTEEWKAGNISTQKLIDMFNAIASSTDNDVKDHDLWNIPVEKCEEEMIKKESLNLIVCEKEPMAVTSYIEKGNDPILGKDKTSEELMGAEGGETDTEAMNNIQNLDEVEACIEALTSSFSDENSNETQEKVKTIEEVGQKQLRELHIYEHTNERKSTFTRNLSDPKKETGLENPKLPLWDEKWKFNLKEPANNDDRNLNKPPTNSRLTNHHHHHQQQQHYQEKFVEKNNTSRDGNLLQVKNVKPPECTGARPRLPQKHSKTGINNDLDLPPKNHVSKIRCNLVSGSEETKSINPNKVGRNFSASFTSAYRSKSQMTNNTRCNGNSNSSHTQNTNNTNKQTHFDILQSYQPHVDKHRHRKYATDFSEGKKEETNKSVENGTKIKITAPRRSNLRRQRRVKNDENNRGFDDVVKGKSLSLSSAYRNTDDLVGIKKRASYMADDREVSKLLPTKSGKNEAELNKCEAYKKVLKGQLWPAVYEIIAPELMFLRARLSGRKVPRLPRGDVFSSDPSAVEISKLLKQLELAIGDGVTEKASFFARKLAEYKVKCSVLKKKIQAQPCVDEIAVNLFIEDKISHTGPITLYLNPTMTVGQLKNKIEKEFDFPTYLQKWILGKRLVMDDSSSLSSFHVTKGCAVFLYLTVEDPNRATMYRKKLETYLKAIEDFDKEDFGFDDDEDESFEDNTNIDFKPPPAKPLLNPMVKKTEIKEIKSYGWSCPTCTLLNDPTRPGCLACTTARPDDYEIPAEYQLKPEEEERLRKERELEDAYRNEQEKRRIEEDRYKAENYQRLIDLDNANVVPNEEEFECLVCFGDVEPGEGIVIRECLHTFCKGCVGHTVEHSETAEVQCPFRDENYSCPAVLQEREIKAVVSKEVYEKHLEKSVVVAENQADNSFHCKTPDCRGWCFYEDEVNQFLCPVCQHTNCLTCQAIHESANCKEYQDRLEFEAATNEHARKTRDLINTMLARGEGMKCPKCGIIIMKKMGCDWMMCTMCRTEICWVTKGPRWGPAGKGDISGGCRCGVIGKCHLLCQYCH